MPLRALATSGIGYAQVVPEQVVDNNGAPQYRVDPFWPKPLPNKWSMQQVVGIFVDHMDHVWFLNRGRSALPIELTAEGNPSPALCCVRGPELIEADQQGNVVTHGAAPAITRSGRFSCRRWSSIRKGSCGSAAKPMRTAS